VAGRGGVLAGKPISGMSATCDAQPPNAQPSSATPIRTDRGEREQRRFGAAGLNIFSQAIETNPLKEGIARTVRTQHPLKRLTFLNDKSAFI
jgi:hypothetical protein